MRAASKLMLGLAVVFAVLVIARAEDKADGKKVTLKGEMTCSKCGLKETAKCGNAIKVKEGDKEVIYFFKDKGKGEKYHKEICTDTKKATVTGVVSEEDGKKYITPDKDGVKFTD